jgi:2,4-dienoyl-CoA reductase-like NADH-dependent reductase (Old Yellow Enzyme family)
VSATAGLSPLAAPLRIGRMELRNRFVATAHSTLISKNGLSLPGDDAYWGRLAEGGAALAICGGAICAPNSTARSRAFGELFSPEIVPGLRRRTEAIHAGGALAVAQALHLGRETLGAKRWEHPVGASTVRSPREPVAPRALAEDEIPPLLELFRVSAQHAVEGGFDGIEIHAAHGYLHAQFLSDVVNTRSDGYAGLEGGVRLLAETIEVIRTVDPEMPVGVRLSEEGHESALNADRICRALALLGERAPIDFLNVSWGVRGEYVRDMGTEEPPLLATIAQISGAAGVPMIASQVFRDAADSEAALDAGAAAVGMARALIADPDLPNKVLAGRAIDVRPCVDCNQDCRDFDPSLLCTVNTDLSPVGDERRPAKPLVIAPRGAAATASGGGRTSASGTRGDGPVAIAGGGATASEGGERGAVAVGANDGPVAIAGAGPAALEAALALAKAGREVTVFEARETLGGQLAVAASAPARHGWGRLLDFYRAQLDAAETVEVRLGTPLAEGALDGYAELILAIGASEADPGDASSGAISAEASLLGGPDRVPSGGEVVILDDGFGWWQAVNCVELAKAGGAAKVTVLTPGGSFAAGIPAESRIQLMPRLKALALETRSFLVPGSFADGKLQARHRFTDAEEQIPADLLIVVGERRPRRLDFDLPAGLGVRAIGDCVVPREVAQALGEGRAAAAELLA